MSHSHNFNLEEAENIKPKKMQLQLLSDLTMGHLGKIFRHKVRSEKNANKNKYRRNAALLTESFVYLISHLNEIFVVFDVVLFLCRSTTIIVMVTHPNESTVIILTQPTGRNVDDVKDGYVCCEAFQASRTLMKTEQEDRLCTVREYQIFTEKVSFKSGFCIYKNRLDNMYTCALQN